MCSNCEPEELLRLEKIKDYRSFAAKEVMFVRGEKLQYVASVVTGVATLSKTLDNGHTQMVGLLLPSDFIGQPGRTRVEFDVRAATDVTLCCFDHDPFQELLMDMPHIAGRMIDLALNELDAARDWMLLLGRKSAEEKIATFIEMVHRRHQMLHGSGFKSQMMMPLSRGDLANYLGLTLETVSRQLGQLKREGVIEFSDKWHFRILDLVRLQMATGNDSDGGVIY